MTRDESLIVERIETFYHVISGPAGHPHNWHVLSSLFALGASILPVRAADSLEALGVEAYVEKLAAVLSDRDFFERGLDYRVTIDGDIAHVWSRYEASNTEAFDEIIKQGTNLIHLVRERQAWRIAGMVYQDDT